MFSLPVNLLSCFNYCLLHQIPLIKESSAEIPRNLLPE